MGVAAGSLTERVTLLIPGLALDDGYGGTLPAAPFTERRVWARVVPVGATEKLYEGQILNGNSFRVTVRTENIHLTGKERVRWKGYEMSVLATGSEGREYTTMICTDSGQ